jgi:hypothetical protein
MSSLKTLQVYCIGLWYIIIDNWRSLMLSNMIVKLRLGELGGVEVNQNET